MPNKKEASATQQFIDIKEIKENTIQLKTGSLRKILLVSGTNFALKSEEEQGIITYAFQGFLNSLDFSVQFFIHSRKLNIDAYLKKLEGREAQEENGLLKNQISEYREFVKTIVGENAIMQKRFFVVVPYDPVQLPGGGGGINIINRLFKRKKSSAATPEKEKSLQIFEEQIQQLNHRVDEVINGLNQIGLRVVPLNNEELVELFYNLYNPATIEKSVDLELEK